MGPDIDQELSAVGEIEELGPSQTVSLLRFRADERRASGQSELLRNFAEIGQARALLKRCRRALVIHASGGVELLDQVHVKAELAQAQGPVQTGPGVAAVPGL